MQKLSKEFYLKDTLTAAKELLGKRLVCGNAEIIITETEAYIGAVDKACHAYGGKRTKRTETLFCEGGVFYVYLIYGMYYCLNVITEKENCPCGVLIRGGKPSGDKDVLSLNRFGEKYESLTPYRKKHLLDGPGKVCMALKIDKSFNGISCLSDEIYIAEGEQIKKEDIKAAKRIGIDYAEEAADFLWRYYYD